jgi:choline dehydrogenase-like flavoprotein
MGPDPETSVVDPHLRHHRVANLFVVDGSVFPTSLGVNPMESILGVARWAVGGIAAAAGA